MPAAAVTPAPRAYTNVAEVQTLVVELDSRRTDLWARSGTARRPLVRFRSQSNLVVLAGRSPRGVRLPQTELFVPFAADTFTLQKA